MSSGFVSETELANRRKMRQLEWEQVRQPDQPLEAPEEDYDHRTLFERLEEQKKLKELEYEETHKLKNMVKGLDDDEVEFLEMVDRSKMDEEKKLVQEEKKELQRFRNRVASLEQLNATQHISEKLVPVAYNLKNTPPKSSQRKLLAGAIKKKSPGDTSSKVDNNDDNLHGSNVINRNGVAGCKRHDIDRKNNDCNSDCDDKLSVPPKRLKMSPTNTANDINSNDETDVENSMIEFPSSRTCVAILPSYYETTDSSNESSVEEYLTSIEPSKLKATNEQNE